MKNEEYYVELIKKIKLKRKSPILTYTDKKQWLQTNIDWKFSARTENLHEIREIIKSNKSNKKKLEQIKEILNLDYYSIMEWYNLYSSAHYYDYYIL